MNADIRVIPPSKQDLEGWIPIDDLEQIPPEGARIRCKGIVYSPDWIEDFQEHRGVYYADKDIFSWSPFRHLYHTSGFSYYEITHWRVI